MLSILSIRLNSSSNNHSFMKQRMRDSLCFRVSDQTREAIERLAVLKQVTIAEISRDLLIEGLRSRVEGYEV